MPVLNQKQKTELEDLIELLGSIKGRHTELVSVLIPAGANINPIQRQIEAEKSTASNIKSKQTRTNVIAALDSIIRKMKEINKTPKNGLALFAGNISDKEGDSDIQTWVYEPPTSLNTRTYRCDQTFVLDPLKEMLEVDEVYGLIVMDRKEATIGLLEGKQIKVLRHLTSGVPGKIRAGGQSSQRFERITEGLAKEFFRRVADTLKELFFDLPKLKGILIGGPIPTKEDFLDQGELVTKLKEKVLAVKDLGNTDEHGLEELVELSQEDIAQQELVKEKEILEKFFNTLGKTKEKAAYGEENVTLALERGAVEILLLSKSLDKKKVKELEEKAVNIGAEIIIISQENQDGEQFENLTKGIGALLRFAIE
jgi:peptide chain release factor subunit 1